MAARSIGAFVLILLFTTFGLAEAPSFDCRKATKPDEIAICGNDQLAANDLETTRLFNQLRRVNRTAALLIAREFLADRSKCTTVECIGHLQNGALLKFSHALGSGWKAPLPAPVATVASDSAAEKQELERGVERTRPAIADDNRLTGALKCSGIADSLSRLTCFDQLFPKAATKIDQGPVATESSMQSAWVVKRETNSIDDTPEIYAHLRPVEQSGSAIGRGRLGLLLRCAENTTSAIISTDLFMTDDPLVTIRLGSSPAQSARWARSSSYQAAGLWGGDAAIPFMRSLRNGEKLVVRVEEDRRQEGTFNLGNVEEVVAEIGNTCGWRP